MSIGDILRARREEKKLSIADISAETKINKKYLQALENNNYLLLPSPVFAKGFLKAYSNFLGLDTKALVDELVNYYKSKEEEKKNLPLASKMPRVISVPRIPMLPKIPTLPKFPDVPKINIDRKTAYIVFFSIAILLLLFSAYGYVSVYLERQVSIKLNPPATGKIEEKLIPMASAIPPGKVEVRLETVGKSWIFVSSGEKVLYSGTLGPDAKLRFIGAEIKVKAGDGGSIKAYVNGKPLGVMGEEGAVVERTYRAQ